MKDTQKRITATFRGAIAENCTALGIDHDSEASIWVGGGGCVSPMVINGELQGFGPTWMFGLELRSLLLGQDPVAGALPIHDVLPNDAAIKATAKRLVHDVEAARQAQFRGV
jgi:hypothetical protein